MISLTRPAAVPNGTAYVTEALASGRVAGDGPFCRRAEALLQQAIGSPRVLLTTSCTHALEMAALLLDIRPGDEVIVPAFTFVSTVNAFVLRGARPVFADIRPDTLNLDEAALPALVTARTRAVVPVHYAGVACEMDAIAEVARASHASVIEDAAHGPFAAYRGKPIGTFGALATLSFHESKNFTCGEGGALLINDQSLVERAEILREKGTDRSKFFRGQIDKYTWVDIGSSYVLSNVLGAMLVAQLEEREAIQRRRGTLWQRYATELADWASASGARLPVVPAHCTPSFHLFHVLVPAARRASFIDHLRNRGVLGVFHYQPLHLSQMGRAYGGTPGQCPVTERVADELVRLPLYPDLTEGDQGLVIDAVRSFSG